MSYGRAALARSPARSGCELKHRANALSTDRARQRSPTSSIRSSKTSSTNSTAGSTVPNRRPPRCERAARPRPCHGHRRRKYPPSDRRPKVTAVGYAKQRLETTRDTRKGRPAAGRLAPIVTPRSASERGAEQLRRGGGDGRESMAAGLASPRGVCARRAEAAGFGLRLFQFHVGINASG